MTGSKRRRLDRSGRAKLRSPGRPPVGRREDRQRFWAAIAAGCSSEAAGAVQMRKPTRPRQDYDVQDTSGVDAHMAPVAIHTVMACYPLWLLAVAHGAARPAAPNGAAGREGSDPARGRPSDGVGACVFSHALPPAGSLPTIDLCGKAVELLTQTASRIWGGHRRGARRQPGPLGLAGLAPARGRISFRDRSERSLADVGI